MIRYIKSSAAILAFALVLGGCDKKDEYSMGALTAPTDVTINAVIVGQDATHPNGDGSGDVKFTITAKNALSYKIDYNAADGISLEFLPDGKVTKKYTTVGLNTYRVTVVAYGTGASATTVTKDIQIRSDFTPDATLVTNLVGAGNTKTWAVDKSLPGHFGVGPWSGSASPDWWAASPDEKVACCNCFYTASFTFTRIPASNTYTLKVTTPDGAFTKTGALANGLPGIPSSGAEGCYPYAGGTSGFTFVPASSSVAASASTRTAVLIDGSNTFIGYGALQKEYEILSISATAMYLRVRGSEPDNAWYIKLKAI